MQKFIQTICVLAQFNEAFYFIASVGNLPIYADMFSPQGAGCSRLSGRTTSKQRLEEGDVMTINTDTYVVEWLSCQNSLCGKIVVTADGAGSSIQLFLEVDPCDKFKKILVEKELENWKENLAINLGVRSNRFFEEN